MAIEEALSHYWKLKVIDQIKTSHSDLPIDVVFRIMTKLMLELKTTGDLT
jgi:hypothetical protein